MLKRTKQNKKQKQTIHSTRLHFEACHVFAMYMMAALRQGRIAPYMGIESQTGRSGI